MHGCQHELAGIVYFQAHRQFVRVVENSYIAVPTMEVRQTVAKIHCESIDFRMVFELMIGVALGNGPNSNIAFLGKPESTDGGSQVSALKWSKGAPLNLG